MSKIEREKSLKCLQQLKNLLKDDDDLKLPVDDENFLIRFVRGKKYDVKKAHETVRKYCILRYKTPNIFKIAYPSYEPVSEILKNNIVMKLKNNDEQGRAVFVWNTPKWDIDKYDLHHMIAAAVVVLEELILFSVDTQINGIVAICNMESMGYRHLKQFSPTIIKPILQIAQGSYPIRIKSTTVVKEPALMSILMLMLRPFMTAKFKARLILHGYQLEKLHAVLPVEKLPESFGGALSEDEAYDENFKQNIFKRDSYYKELLEYGIRKSVNEEEDR